MERKKRKRGGGRALEMAEGKKESKPEEGEGKIGREGSVEDDEKEEDGGGRERRKKEEEEGKEEVRRREKMRRSKGERTHGKSLKRGETE